MWTMHLALAAAVAVPQSQPAAPNPVAEAYYLFLDARQLEGRGDVEGALRALGRATALVPEAAEIRAELAAMYARQGRAAESIDEARRALALDGGSREAHRILGFVLATMADERGDKAMADEALGHFERVIGGGGRDAAAELAAGRLAVERERYDLAIRWLTAFLLDQDGYPEAMRLLARAYEGAGRPADAAPLVARLVSQSPEVVDLRVWLAELREAADQWDEAATAWRDAESARPAELLYPMRRAMALINGGQVSAGREVLAELARRAPDDVRVLYFLAQAELRSGNAARAVTVLEGAVARAPDDDELRFALAAAYDEADRFESAERIFREIIAASPAHAGALNYLGYLLADRGERLDEAVSLITRALAVERDNPSYLDSLGWAYFRLGDFSRAQGPLERAAQALPETSVVQDHLGDLYVGMKRYRDAVRAFDQSLAGDRRGIDVVGVTRKRDRARELAGGR